MITDQVISFWNDLDSLQVVEKSNIFARIIKNLVKLGMNYFTLWILIFHVLYYSGVVKKYQASLLLLSVIVSLNGFLLVYYYPKKIKVPYLNITATGGGLYNTYMSDFIFHQLPLIFLLMNYDNRIKPDSLILGMVIGGLYLITQNYEKAYNVKCSGCKKAHKGNIGLIRRCLVTCGIFNLEIIILLLFLLVTLVRSLLKG